MATYIRKNILICHVNVTSIVPIRILLSLCDINKLTNSVKRGDVRMLIKFNWKLTLTGQPGRTRGMERLQDTGSNARIEQEDFPSWLRKISPNNL